MVGYNVQTAVDTEHHLIVAHEVMNVGTDKSLLSHMAKRTKAALETDALEVVADRGYYKSDEILGCRSMPYLPLHARRTRTDATPLLEQCLSGLRYQGSMYPGQAAEDHPLGA